MGAAVRTLIGLALCAAGACSGDEDPGLGVVPGDAGGGRSDASVTPDAATARDSAAPPRTEPNVGAACARDADCVGPKAPRCEERIDPGATVEGVLLVTEDLFGSGVDDGGVWPTVSDLEVAVPGGYCSGACVNDADCGDGAACFGLAPLLALFGLLPDGGMPGGFFSDSGICLQPCDRDGDCRELEGHVCRDGLAGAPPLPEISGVPTLTPFTVCLPPPP